MTLLRTIWTRRELLWNLTARELKQRYKGSALGFLWSVLILKEKFARLSLAGLIAVCFGIITISLK